MILIEQLGGIGGKWRVGIDFSLNGFPLEVTLHDTWQEAVDHVQTWLGTTVNL